VTTPVVVARRDLHAGDVIAVDDTAVREWPAAVVPPGALHEAPLGRALRADVAAGEALVAPRVAGAGTHGPAAALPDGWRAVAVVPGTLPPLAAGAVVDVYAVADPAASGDQPALRVAAAARVVAVDDGTVTIAVPESLVGRVTAAAATGAVSLALVPG
jgi:pilus assembly protein CpaB